MTRRCVACTGLYVMGLILLGWLLSATGAQAVMTETQLTNGTANDEIHPAICGNHVVFEDNREGQIDIWLYDIRTQLWYRISRAGTDETWPDICEDRIVWEDRRNGDIDVYTYDLSVDTDGDGIPNYRDSDRPDPDPAETPVAVVAGSNQQRPKISDTYVVWDDRRGGDPEWADIYVYELATGLTTPLTAANYQVQPAVWGSRVVWADYRSGLTTGWDIYMYDGASGQVRPICTAVDDQTTPTICGDRIAWEDLRISGGLPEPTADIFMYDLVTEEEYSVVVNIADQISPVLSQDWLAWVDDRRSTKTEQYLDVYMYDFRTARELIVLANDYPHWFPDIYWNRIVYQDNRYGDYDLFMATFSVTLGRDWSLMSIPYEPDDPSPHGVLGTVADNSLFRWDLSSHSYIMFDPLQPELFGDMATGQGYWLTLATGQAFDYSGERYTAPRQISLPTANWHLIGLPFDLPVNLADCKFENTDTHETLTFDEAYQQGWIRQPLYYFDPFMDGYFAAGTGIWHRRHAMWPWYGYWLNTRIPNLRLLMPVPSIADNGAPLVNMVTPLPGAIVNPPSVYTQWTTNNDEIAWNEVRMDDDDWTDNGASKSYTFTDVTPGAHTIYVRVVDKAANIGYASVSFQVNSPPTAEFTFAPESPVVNQSIQFTDQSSDSDGTVVAWSWDFGDGGASTATNPTHQYTSSGPFNVTLTVIDNRGAEGSVTHEVVVIENLLPTVDNIAYVPENPTDLDNIEFTGSATDPDGFIVDWVWTFGDGHGANGQVVTHDYAEDGEYTVALTVTDNDDGQGSGSVLVSVANVAPTDVDFTWVPTTPSTADTITFLGSGTDPDGTIVSWAWDFGDGGSAGGQGTTHKYAANATYTVVLTVTDNDGAVTTAQHDVVISNEPPSDLSIDYVPTSPTDLDLITFTGSAIDRDGYIDRWEWDFGDGHTGTGQEVPHQYADDGTYTVKMTVTDNEGAFSDETVSVEVANVPPTGVDFTWTPPEPSDVDTIAFEGLGSDPDGSIVSWHWDFGDGETADVQNTTHQYAARATYTVVLTVTDDDDAVVTAQHDVVVDNAAPENLTIDYAPASPTDLDTVTFTGDATDRDGYIEGWAWDFGDESTDSGQVVTHQYADDGTYTVTFTATDNEGKSSSETTDVEVINVAPIDVDFTWTPPEPSSVDTIIFEGSGTDPDGTIVSWEWDFDDGQTGSGQTATHQYAIRATYTVVLSVTDDDGAVVTALHDVVVANARPQDLTVHYVRESPPALDTITFTGDATDRDGFIAAWDWDFGDGDTDTGQVVTHQYAGNGTYTVTFTVSDNEGKTSSITLDVSVGNELPIASFIYQPAYPQVGQEIQFFDTSIDPDGEIVGRDWSFGDNVTGHGPQPRHTYAQASVYTVTLIVTDNRGGVATATDTIDLTNAAPTAAFTWAPSSPTTADVIEFTDTSTDSDGSVVAWAWYFGDGSAPSAVQNPSHQFTQAGTYWVSLEVTDDGGATAAVWQSITVTAP